MTGARDKRVYVTPTETIGLLRRHGIWLRKGLGQHFLVDNNVVLNVLGAAGVTPGDVILEVGPGIGSLTRGLAEHAKAVVAVEVDERMADCFRENVTAENVALLQMNALRLRHADLVNRGLVANKLVSNLPYNVAVPLLLHLLAELPEIEEAVVMVQREVADRMCAAPRSKAYGAVTVKLAYYGDAHRLFVVPPAVFVPAPRVESAVVRWRRTRVATADRQAVFAVVQASFSQRRKKLVNALAAAMAHTDKERIAQALREAGLAVDVRAEQLTIQDFIRLAHALSNGGCELREQ